MPVRGLGNCLERIRTLRQGGVYYKRELQGWRRSEGGCILLDEFINPSSHIYAVSFHVLE